MTDLSNGEPMFQHPETELMAAYLSGTLSPGEQAALETHMARCRSCRQEATSARRLIRSYSSPRRGLLLAPAAAAAILALVLLSRGPAAPRPVDEPVRAGDEAAAGLTAYAPLDRDTVGGHGVVFTWASQAGRPLYRLTLTDGSGQAAWLRETSDTTLALPAEILLEPGRAYFWYVDALDAAGSSLTTGTHRFTISP